MSLTPDYFISGNGYPKLNREKFKLLPKSQNIKKLTTSENIPIQRVTNTKINSSNDKKKLLTKRENNNTNNYVYVTNTTKTPTTSSLKTSTNSDRNRSTVLPTNSASNNKRQYKWAISDKERKCYINQRIKDLGIGICRNNSDSNHQLDNRLIYQRRYFNGAFGYNQKTDKIVLPTIEV